MDERAINAKLASIFQPLATNRISQFYEQGGRFVHYTTAENALNIIKTKSVWMRNARCMNDISEVEHGFAYLNDFFRNKQKKDSFLAALNKASPGVAEEAVQRFDGWLNHIRTGTYITCISEHDDSEDRYGRLSMWREYRDQTVGVALVLNPEPFRLETDALRVYGSPVTYIDEQDFVREFERVVSNIDRETDFLKTVPREVLINQTFNSLLFAITCSKHPGFHEEREWRLIHLPEIFPSETRHVRSEVEIVRGVPQLVHKIPLKNIPEEGLTGIEPDELINKVIVGPSDFPFQIYEAFVETLTNNGVTNAAARVSISNIPLRV